MVNLYMVLSQLEITTNFVKSPTSLMFGSRQHPLSGGSETEKVLLTDISSHRRPALLSAASSNAETRST